MWSYRQPAAALWCGGVVVAHSRYETWVSLHATAQASPGPVSASGAGVRPSHWSHWSHWRESSYLLSQRLISRGGRLPGSTPRDAVPQGPGRAGPGRDWLPSLRTRLCWRASSQQGPWKCYPKWVLWDQKSTGIFRFLVLPLPLILRDTRRNSCQRRFCTYCNAFHIL